MKEAFMSVQPLLKPAQADWSTDLAKLGPQIADEGRACDAENRYVGANIAVLREHGFLGLAVPAELGGGGLSRTELANMLRELAHYCSATALVLAMHTHTVAAAAWRWRYQKAPTDGLLKRVAAERLQLLSSGGSDWLPGSGTAEKVEGGYKVNGLKVFASGAPSADIFMTGAVEQTAEGPTALQFGVPMKSPGVSIVETWDTLGMRGTRSDDVVLEGAFVPDKYVSRILPAGGADAFIVAVFAWALMGFANVYYGVAQRAFDLAIERVKTKKSMAVTRTMAYHPEVQHAVAEMGLSLDTIGPHLDHVAKEWSDGVDHGATWPAKIVSAKHHAVEACWRIVDLAMEVSGGSGMFKTDELERLFRDARCGRFHPANAMLVHEIVAKTALGIDLGEQPRWG
jgi:alkylation response protein AidB-like acyl-CoA dehydrogenase